MPDPTKPFSAYEAPIEAGYVRGPQVQMTTGVKAICIIAIILGVLGGLSAVFGVVGMVAGSMIQDMVPQPQIPGNEGMRQVQEAQEKVNDATIALQRQYMPAIIVKTVVHSCVALGLLVGGIATLTGSGRGRSILRLACGVAIPYELGNAVLGTLMQIETINIMRPLSEAMQNATGGAGPPMGSLIQIGMMVGIAFTMALVLAKIVFYAISFFKLRTEKPEKLELAS